MMTTLFVNSITSADEEWHRKVPRRHWSTVQLDTFMHTNLPYTSPPMPVIYLVSRWYSLAGRRESRKTSVDDDEDEARGQVQVTLTFMVQSQSTPSDQTVAPSSRFQRQRSLSFRALASRVGKQFRLNLWPNAPVVHSNSIQYPMYPLLRSGLWLTFKSS